MNNEFKKLTYDTQTVYVLENATSGGTSSGAVASNTVAVGGVQRRKPKDSIIVQGYEKKIPASTPRNFVAKNAKTSGAGTHKKPSPSIPRHDKHKNKPVDMSEDHSTATGGWGQGAYASGSSSKWNGAGRDDSVHETPIEMDPSEPMNPMIYGHGSNPAKLNYRMTRAAGQLKDLAQRAQNASPVEWEMITRQFSELTMNIEEIKHAIAELSNKRKKGGAGSRGIDKNIGEQGMAEVFQNDESNLYYRYDTSDGKLKQRMVHNNDERQAFAQGFKDTPELALKAAGIIRSKFDPKKFVQNQGGKWVQVFPYGKEQGVAEGSGQQLTVQQLATISDEALDNAYHYGRSTPGNTFGWQANLKSAAYAKQMIDKGVTDIETISDAIHKGWNVTAQAFVQNPAQFSDTEKLKAAGKLEAKLQQRAELMKQNYARLPEEEKEKDRVVARALLQAVRGQQGVAEGSLNEGQYEMMMRNGQVKKFIAKDDADAKRIAAGHGAKSVIKLRGGVPAGKVAEQGVAEQGYGNHPSQRVDPRTGKKYVPPKSPLGQGVAEAKGLKKRVRIVKGPEAGKTGTIGEVRHGAFKGAPKTFTVDIDGGGSIQLPKEALRLLKDQGMSENSEELVGFHLDTELAYQAVMRKFGNVVSQDPESGTMYVPASVWTQVEQVAFDADGRGAEREEGVAEGSLNEFAQGDFNGGDDSNDLQLYLNVAKKLNMKKYKPSTAHDLIAKKMAELVDAVDDEKVDWARHMARKAQGLPSMLDQQGVAEDRENFNGINLLLQKDDEEVFVKASAGSRELGHVLFVMDGDYLMPQDLEVEERYRGQGIAQTMYDFVKSKGYKIRRSGQQTDAGAGFWAKHRPEQNVWEEGVAEGVMSQIDYKIGEMMGKYIEKYQKGLLDADHFMSLISKASEILARNYKMDPADAQQMISNYVEQEIGDQDVVKGDSYMESLAAKLSEKIPANAPVSAYIDDFMKAAKTPNAKGHHQFKNKNPKKIQQMAVAASYSAKNPSKKKK